MPVAERSDTKGAGQDGTPGEHRLGLGRRSRRHFERLGRCGVLDIGGCVCPLQVELRRASAERLQAHDPLVCRELEHRFEGPARGSDAKVPERALPVLFPLGGVGHGQAVDHVGLCEPHEECAFGAGAQLHPVTGDA